MKLYIYLVIKTMKTMKNIHATDSQQDSLKTGARFDTFYDNGEKAGCLIISRLTGKSVFYYKDNKSSMEFRISRNTFRNYISKGFYKES